MKKTLLKILTIIFSLSMCLSLATACGGDNNGSNGQSQHVHNYKTIKYNELNHWYECACGAKKEEEAHKEGTATCKDKAVCSVCSQKYGELAGHSADDSGYCTTCDYIVGYTKGIIYDKSSDGTYAEVMGYEGSSTKISIAPTYNNLPVKSICKNAFKESNVTKVNIPKTIESIGDEAFFNCKSLQSIEICNSQTNIGVNAFKDCLIEKAIIPTSAISSIPKSVLKEVVINGGTDIDDWAFQGCRSLQTIGIGSSVKYISDWAFEFCESLQTIKIPNSVLRIGDGAFNYCTSLQLVQIGSGVVGISYDAFKYCPSLKSIEVDSANANYKSIDGNLYCQDGKTLIRYATGKSNASFTVPNGVTTIDREAFSGCDSLEAIEIPNSVTSIGRYAFENCNSLESIEIPNSVEVMGEWAFYGCDSLTTIYCKVNSRPSAWNSYWNSGCSAEVIWDGNTYTIIDGIKYLLTTMGSAQVVEYSSSITTANIPSSITYNGDTYAVTSIGASAFLGCTSLQSVVIGDSVENIFMRAFSECTSLQSVVIGNSVTRIDTNAFYCCTSLQSIVLPNSVEFIGAGAFVGCDSLKSVVIPNSVEIINSYVFSDCDLLTTIYCEASSKPIGWESDWNSNCTAEVVWGYTED